MKKLGTALLTIYLLGFCACKQQDTIPLELDDDGVVLSVPPVWTNRLSPSDDALNYGVIKPAVQHDGNVLLPKQNVDGGSLVMISAKDGTIIWEWSDFFVLHRSRPTLTNVHQAGSTLIVGRGTHIYGIDLTNGQTLFKRRYAINVRRVNGTETRAFVTGHRQSEGAEHGQTACWEIDLESGELTELFSPPQTADFRDGNGNTSGIGVPLPIQLEDGETYISFTYHDPLPDWRTNLYLGLYHPRNDSIVYSGQRLYAGTPVGANGPDLGHDGLLYLAPDAEILCYDAATGQRKWEASFASSFTFSGITLADDVILANCEDTYLYALNAQTGQRQWREKSSGTSSRLVAHNGVVYYVGGGDGLLHAVEIATGQHLWRIRSPDLSDNPGAWFMPKVNIVTADQSGGDTDIVVVSSYLGAFGYGVAR